MLFLLLLYAREFQKLFARRCRAVPAFPGVPGRCRVLVPRSQALVTRDRYSAQLCDDACHLAHSTQYVPGCPDVAEFVPTVWRPGIFWRTQELSKPGTHHR